MSQVARAAGAAAEAPQAFGSSGSALLIRFGSFTAGSGLNYEVVGFGDASGALEAEQEASLADIFRACHALAQLVQAACMRNSNVTRGAFPRARTFVHNQALLEAFASSRGVRDASPPL